MSLAVSPFLVQLKSPLGVIKYVLFQETFSILLRMLLILSVENNYFIMVLLLMKIGVAPFGKWLENILDEIKESLYFVFTLPKIVPITILSLFCRGVWLNFMVVVIIRLFIRIKILCSFDLKLVVLYLGNFSVLFSAFLGIFAAQIRLVWFYLYCFRRLIILYGGNLEILRFFDLFWISALPPSPFFFLKIFLIFRCGGLPQLVFI